MIKNIEYQTSHLADYFINNRRTWDEFYPSERWMFSMVGDAHEGFGRVLDVGCAVGGLGRALSEKYHLSSYTGIDINQQAIEYANAQSDNINDAKFLCADIVTTDALKEQSYDSVFALSVADWNVDVLGILEACWQKVAPGGCLILTQRLTDKASALDHSISYQHIVPAHDYIVDELSELEKAPYMVLNAKECLRILGNLHSAPSEINAYGYWGAPSKTAVTPFEKIAFAVISLTKPDIDDAEQETVFKCHLPVELFY